MLVISVFRDCLIVDKLINWLIDLFSFFSRESERSWSSNRDEELWKVSLWSRGAERTRGSLRACGVEICNTRSSWCLCASDNLEPPAVSEEMLEGELLSLFFVLSWCFLPFLGFFPFLSFFLSLPFPFGVSLNGASPVSRRVATH